MKQYLSTLLISVMLISCNQTSKTDDKDQALTKKENELLKKENELLKKEQELNQKSATDNSTVIQKTDNSTSNNLDFLKKLNGKSAGEVGLLDNFALKQRLKKLLGTSRYNFIKETCTVSSATEFSNNIFVASACEAHNCGFTNFIIVVDFSTNVMYVGIREEGNVKTYSEDGSNSSKVNEWGNDGY